MFVLLATFGLVVFLNWDIPSHSEVLIEKWWVFFFFSSCSKKESQQKSPFLLQMLRVTSYGLREDLILTEAIFSMS